MIKENFLAFLKRIVKNNKFQIIIFNIFFLLLLLLLFEPTTKSDDYDMANLAYGGVDGQYSPFLLYSNVLFGYLTKFLLALFPKISWFYVIQYILMFIGFCVVTYIFYKRNEPKIGIFINALFLLIVGYEFYIRITFSKTSGFLIASGYLFLLYLIDNQNKKKGAWLLAYLLIIFGILIRANMFLGITLVFVSSFLIFCIRSFNQKDKNLIKKIIQFILVVILLYISSNALSKLSSGLYNSDDIWEDYLTDNIIRATLVDYGIPDYDTCVEEYEKIGVSKNDYVMWFQLANRGDRAILTNEKYQEIVNIRETVVVDKIPKSQRIIDGIYDLLEYQKNNTMFYFLLIAALCFLIIEKKGFCIVVLFANVFCVIAYLYLCYTGRTQHHVDASLYLAGGVIILYFIKSVGKEIKADFKKCILLTTLVAIIFVNYFYNDLITSSYYGASFGVVSSQKEQYEERYEILSLFSEDEEHFYIIGAKETNNVYACFTVFEPIEKGFYENIYRPNMNHIPVFENILEKYEIRNVWDEITNSDKIYHIVSQTYLSDLQIVENYIREHYNENAHRVLVKQVEDMYVYRFIDDKFSVDLSEVKDDISDIVYSVEKLSNEDGSISISGYAYVEGRDSYAQNIYIQAINLDTGEDKVYTCLQTENEECHNYDKYGGKYSSFSSVIGEEELNKIMSVENRNIKFNLLLEIEGEIYQIPIE